MEKAALITGATSGFGREFAELFARDGNNLVLVARRGDVLEQVKKELEESYNVEVLTLQKDLSEDKAAEEVFSFTQGKGIAVTALVNNAGYGDWSAFCDADEAKLDSMIRLNVLALFRLCRLYAPLMKERKEGRILNVASIAAFVAGPMMATYYATKAFVLSLSESLAEELKGSGVTVTALCPGPSDTGFARLAALEGSSFAKAFSHTSAKSVARYGYKKLKAGKVTALPGASTKAMAFFIKILPRPLARKAVFRLQRT